MSNILKLLESVSPSRVSKNFLKFFFHLRFHQKNSSSSSRIQSDEEFNKLFKTILINEKILEQLNKTPLENEEEENNKNQFYQISTTHQKSKEIRIDNFNEFVIVLKCFKNILNLDSENNYKNEGFEKDEVVSHFEYFIYTKLEKVNSLSPQTQSGGGVKLLSAESRCNLLKIIHFLSKVYFDRRNINESKPFFQMGLKYSIKKYFPNKKFPDEGIKKPIIEFGWRDIKLDKETIQKYREYLDTIVSFLMDFAEFLVRIGKSSLGHSVSKEVTYVMKSIYHADSIKETHVFYQKRLAVLLANIGERYKFSHSNERSMKQFSRAVKIFNEFDVGVIYCSEYLDVFQKLGQFYKSVGKYLKCKYTLKRCENILKNFNNRVESKKGRLYGTQGQIYTLLGEKEIARRKLDESFEIKKEEAKKDKDTLSQDVGISWHDNGQFLFWFGKKDLEYYEAISCYKKAIKLKKDANISIGLPNIEIAFSRYDIAQIHMLLENYDESLKEFNLSLEIYEKYNNKENENTSEEIGLIYFNKAQILISKGDFENSELFYKKSMLKLCDCAQNIRRRESTVANISSEVLYKKLKSGQYINSVYLVGIAYSLFELYVNKNLVKEHNKCKVLPQEKQRIIHFYRVLLKQIGSCIIEMEKEMKDCIKVYKASKQSIGYNMKEKLEKFRIELLELSEKVNKNELKMKDFIWVILLNRQQNLKIKKRKFISKEEIAEDKELSLQNKYEMLKQEYANMKHLVKLEKILGCKNSLKDFLKYEKFEKIGGLDIDEIGKKELQHGVNAYVYKGKFRDVEIAIKVIINVEHKKTRSLVENYLEKEFLNQLDNHRNICRVLRAFKEDVTLLKDSLPKWKFKEDIVLNDTIIFVMPLYDRNLKQEMKRKKKFTEEEVLYYMKEILTGLCFLYQNNIVHCDLKPDNIFLTEKEDILFGLSSKVVISDFGCCHDFTDHPDFIVDYPMGFLIQGAPFYKPPEILLAKPGLYSKLDFRKYDIYSLGIIIYQILNPLVDPFQGRMNERNERNYVEIEDAQYTKGLKLLIKEMLAEDPKKRISCFDCLAKVTKMMKRGNIIKQVNHQGEVNIGVLV